MEGRIMSLAKDPEKGGKQRMRSKREVGWGEHRR